MTSLRGDQVIQALRPEWRQNLEARAASARLAAESPLASTRNTLNAPIGSLGSTLGSGRLNSSVELGRSFDRSTSLSSGPSPGPPAEFPRLSSSSELLGRAQQVWKRVERTYGT